jgi:putative ABC transport system ATP-binding protein
VSAAPHTAVGPVALAVRQLAKRYGNTAVFQGVNLEVATGEFVAIVGESGVGKSSLLNCLAGLDSWSEGQILHQGLDLSTMDESQLALWRRQHLGFVFQAFHVLPHLDVAQNVGLPLLLLNRPDPRRVHQMLDAVGLHGMEQRLPAELSGGQLQRVAIARALVHRPGLLLADEPTGNLDSKSTEQVFESLSNLAREQGKTVLVVTHDLELAARMDRRIHLVDGMLAEPEAAA